jgi:putative ABC transport system ATP-binding protein
VELRGVQKSYEEGGREHRVLDGVNAVVKAGERVGILGPSGSGKSTLLNLISGIDVPGGGVVKVGGADLTALSEHQRTLFRREHLGFVFQFFNLIPTLTVLENLLLPLELNGVEGPEAEARASALLEATGLHGRGDAYPDRLTGGEQQRVGVARALIHEPTLVLADEPTGNLDEDTGEAVARLLERLVTDRGHTLMVVTHSRALARRMDRVLRLDHGTLVEGMP